MREQQLLINGRWVPGVDTFEVRDPLDLALVGTVAVASPQQASDAVYAARDAMLLDWPAAARAELLLSASRLVAERSAEFAELIRAGAGKPITAALGEWSGNSCELLVLSESELQAPVRHGDRPVNELRRDAVHLTGGLPQTLLGRRAS